MENLTFKILQKALAAQENTKEMLDTSVWRDWGVPEEVGAPDDAVGVEWLVAEGAEGGSRVQDGPQPAGGWPCAGVLTFLVQAQHDLVEGA